MMGSYTITRRIAASPERVFRAFTDPTLVADWMDGSRVTDTTGPLDAAGTSYTLVIRGPWRFRTRVVRCESPVSHETVGSGPLGSSYRMVANLNARGEGTELEILTEYTVPLGPIGRWMDRRWLEGGPHTTANREVDRLVELVSDHGPRAMQDGGVPAGRVPAQTG